MERGFGERKHRLLFGTVALTFALLIIPALPGVAAAPSSDDVASSTLPEVPYAVTSLIELPARLDEPGAFERAMLAQFERQGALPFGTLGTIEPPSPPSLRYRDVYPACDFDTDGVDDAIMNELDLSDPPSHDDGRSRIAALSGATGEEIWSLDNWFHMEVGPSASPLYKRYGNPLPGDTHTMRPLPDTNGDGICDVLALSVTREFGVSVPYVGSPSVTLFTVHVRMVSGADGLPLWDASLQSTREATATPIVDGVQQNALLDFPTGILIYETPSGPKFVLKTTDLYYEHVRDPLGLQNINLLGRVPSPIKSRLMVQNLYVTEHIQLRDARTGDLYWQRDLPFNSDSEFTNITWITGVADLAGNAEPEIVLDQFVMTNPNSNEFRDPVMERSLYRYGRGMRMTALAGEIEGTGASVWTTMVLEPLVAQPNPPLEEPFETLAWTHATILPDIDGDGKADPVALYVASEENLGSTVEGRYRTHFIPLSGANGTKLWDVRQQGWGAIQSLATGPDSPPYLGIGTLDVPTRSPPGGRFPPKFVRLATLDARDGQTMWSYEKAFGQNSVLSYALALAQYMEALAPRDYNGDGLLDLITPAQYAPPTGNDQLLLATASHSYGVMSGADGSVLATIVAWGSTGRVIACGGDGTELTTISGHARRLDISRFNVVTGEKVWRHPIHNDPAPRAASAALDVLALGARCFNIGDDTRYAINMQAYSFDRGAEVVSIRGAIGDDGETRFMIPPVRGTPLTSSIFDPKPLAAPETGPSIFSILLAVPLGLGAGAATLLVKGRGRSGRGASGLIGVTIVLLLAGTIAMPLASPALPTDGALVRAADATTPLPSTPATDATARISPATPQADTTMDDASRGFVEGLRDLGDGITAESHMALATEYLRAKGANVPDSGAFETTSSIAFTYDIGDADGDGITDVALDEYCVAYSSCRTFYRLEDLVTAWTTPGDYCGPRHRLWAVSGANGDVIWNQSLDVRRPVLSCGKSFVMGTVPLKDSTGIIVYEHVATYPALLDTSGTYEHRVYLIDGATGDVKWEFTEVGSRASDLITTDATTNIILNTIIQSPLDDDATLISPGTEPAIFIQGVGYTTTAAHSLTAPPGFSQPVIITDHYQPNEWAARLDTETGAEVWRRATFTPDPEKSVYPTALNTPSLLDGWGLPPAVPALHWRYTPCCFDNTGDGIPDLVFTTLEWSPTPTANTQGPFLLASRLVTFDGASGDTIIDTLISPSIEVPDAGGRRAYDFTFMSFGLPNFGYSITPQLIGDANGDGTADIILHELFLEGDFEHLFTVRSGVDASELWRLESKRDLRILVIGDATGDGANDILFLDWYGHEARGDMTQDYVTPRSTPLTLRDGRTGEIVWRVENYAAPIDAAHAFSIMRVNGLPDFDEDGVGDIIVDDPSYLGDQTVIHRLTAISGRTGRALYEFDAVGAFAITARAPDVTGDGISDLALLSGDLNDLWMTIQDGRSGEPVWARRILAVPASSFAEVFPRFSLQSITRANGTGDDILINLHLEARTAYWTIYFNEDGFSEGTGFDATTIPQMMRLDGKDGKLGFALPALNDYDLEATVRGPAPGIARLHEIQAPKTPVKDATATLVTEVAPPAASFTTSYLSVLALASIARRFKRSDEEVPDLD